MSKPKTADDNKPSNENHRSKQSTPKPVREVVTNPSQNMQNALGSALKSKLLNRALSPRENALSPLVGKTQTTEQSDKLLMSTK
jgi:hypothetical protein